MTYVILTYEQDYYESSLSGLDYEDYSVRLELLPNGLTLCVL